MIIAGERITGARQEELRSPYDHEVIETVAVAGVDDVDRAIAVAVRGAKHQRRLTAHQREAILRRAGDIADARVDDLARTISAETGKPISEAQGEASRVGDLLRLSGFEGSQLYGHSLPLDAAPNGGSNRLGFTVRQPCGVVVAITPFNFPALLVVHKIGPALATGNAVVLKPARQTPLTALKLCEIFLEAGLHPEAISCVTGPGEVLGDALCADPRVRKVSFTGSFETGDRICAVAGVKKLSLELGASCPVVILPDADIESAASAIAVGGYSNAGQVCISVQRVVVDRRVAGDLLDALVPKVEAIKIGDPSEPDTALGSLISEQDAVRVEAALHEGSENGARIVTGGERDGSVLTPGGGCRRGPGEPAEPGRAVRPRRRRQHRDRRRSCDRGGQRHPVRARGRHLHQGSVQRDSVRARGRFRKHPRELDAAVAGRPDALRRPEGQRDRQGGTAVRRRGDDRSQDGGPARSRMSSGR